MYRFLSVFVLFLVISLSIQASNKGTLVIQCENLKSSKGNVVVKLYDVTSPKFPDTKSAIVIKTVKITNNQAPVVFEDLPFGQYAFTTFHDENENGKMDTNHFYLPTEGNAFSNNQKILFGPPSFNKASFDLKQEKLTVKVALSY